MSTRARPLLWLCALALLGAGLLFAPRAAGTTEGGRPVAWGCGVFNDHGQCSVPSRLSDVVERVRAAFSVCGADEARQPRGKPRKDVHSRDAPAQLFGFELASGIWSAVRTIRFSRSPSARTYSRGFGAGSSGGSGGGRSTIRSSRSTSASSRLFSPGGGNRIRETFPPMPRAEELVRAECPVRRV